MVGLKLSLALVLFLLWFACNNRPFQTITVHLSEQFYSLRYYHASYSCCAGEGPESEGQEDKAEDLPALKLAPEPAVDQAYALKRSSLF